MLKTKMGCCVFVVMVTLLGIVNGEFLTSILKGCRGIASELRDAKRVLRVSFLPPIHASTHISMKRNNNMNPLLDIVTEFKSVPMVHESSNGRDKALFQLSALCGKGHSAFCNISSLVLTGALTNQLSWAQVISEKGGLGENTTIATVTQFFAFPLFSVNPSRITKHEFDLPAQKWSVEPQSGINSLESPPGGQDSVKRYSRLVYRTLPGNLLSGVESFTVKLMDNDNVTFEMATYAGPGMSIMRPFMPLARILQRKFFNDHIRHLHRVLESQTSQPK